MILKILKKVYVKYKISRLNNILLLKNVTVNIHSKFEGFNSIYNNTEFINSKIGLGSYIANNCIIRNTKIGRFCAIGDNVRTSLGIHPSHGFVSIHPAFFSTKKQAGFSFVDKQLFEEHRYVDNEKRYVVEIGNDVWIGNNVIIMDGITIGDGAIIAAGSIITKDISPYSIIAGIPGKIIKYRFEQKIIQFLLEFQWWNKEYDWILENANTFTDITTFYNKFSSPND
jgi:acetyltransferase-like isoleucine patch superfamily enzyme